MAIVKVLGVDPSFKNLGVAFATVDTETLAIDVHRVDLTTTEPSHQKNVRKSSEDYDRARVLAVFLLEASLYAGIVMVEMPIGSKSAAAMKGYGVVMGVLGSCLASPIQISPQEVKLASVGSKVATKEQVIAWAHGLYPNAKGWKTMKRNGVVTLTAANEHMADAVAAIHAGVKTDQFRQAVAMANALRAA